MKTIYFQILCGASGDMILSSLIDLGVPIQYLQSECARLDISGLALSVEKVHRGGVICSHIDISCDEQKAYRHLPQIVSLIKNAGYRETIIENCERILNRLASAEARVHNIPVEKVHFHEIGAVDTIVDILGVCLGFDYLGVTDIRFSALTVGSGTIRTAHGIMPVPAPATAEMIKDFTSGQLDIGTEILTPTGAAILTGIGNQDLSMPSGAVSAIGYGCGDKVFEKFPNMLRALMIETDSAQQASDTSDRICVLESDMDHISGEIMAFAAEQLFSQGALDVSWTPVFMKKGRPGYRLCVMCKPDKRDALIDCIIGNTHTLGVRYQTMQRTIAPRRGGSTEIDGNSVQIKQAAHKGHAILRPEYESLAQVAREKNIPLIDLLEQYYRGKST